MTIYQLECFAGKVTGATCFSRGNTWALTNVHQEGPTSYAASGLHPNVLSRHGNLLKIWWHSVFAVVSVLALPCSHTTMVEYCIRQYSHGKIDVIGCHGMTETPVDGGAHKKEIQSEICAL